MLGISASTSEVNRKLEAIGNFLIILLVQMLFQLYDLLALNRFPTEWEIYRALIVSAIATVVFYGYNKVTVKQDQDPNGVCCEAHLLTKINEYIKEAKDNTVTVTLMDNPKCDYCNAKARYIVTYFPK